jgi:hypothetical protein
MKPIKTQFGLSTNADFEENLWAFLMPEGFKVRAGEFAIVDKQLYDEMLNVIHRVGTTETKELLSKLVD